MRTSTRHSSLSLCDLDLNFLKVMSILKENINNNAADGMSIQKQVKSVSYLQLVSYIISISTIQMKIHINLTQDAKTWFNQPAWRLKRYVIWLKKIAKMVRWT